MKRLFCLAFVAVLAVCSGVASAQQPAFRVLAFYSKHVEADHVEFAEQALPFFENLAKKDHFLFTATTWFGDLNAANLKRYQLVVWLDDMPSRPAQRAAFKNYMRNGGAWLGFHIAGYNDSATHWPWFVQFLGGAVFDSNSWPPLPATLAVNDPKHPVTAGLPPSFVAPANEWYIWKPNPRASDHVKVLLSLKASNYPLGWKDTLVAGDLPVVWSNTRYRMLYLNMGHGDKIFTSATQNHLVENAVLWLGKPKQ